ncbi:MAG: hypothetical protein WEE89_17370 [Gemmatimonadota bacterium]
MVEWPVRPRSAARLLLSFLAAPLAWTVHLVLSYALLTAGCAAGWRGTRIAIIAVTLGLAALSLLSAYAVTRDWPRPMQLVQWLAREEENTPEPHFLLGLGLIATGAFTLAILLGGFGTLLLPLCHNAH